MKKVKIIIGANYGDEGKGLVTRHFVCNAKENGEYPIVILHNGSGQRGHTIEYEPKEKGDAIKRHVYHHFGVGVKENIPTYYADTFLIHPMEYAVEYQELKDLFGRRPVDGYCSPNCMVITPFDMLVDQATKIWIESTTGQKSYGTCGYGTWCACEDRFKRGKTAYTLSEYEYTATLPDKMFHIWKECQSILKARGVDVDRMPGIKEMFSEAALENAIKHFRTDLLFFFNTTSMKPYNFIWKTFNTHIFEGGQGLGLDKRVHNDYHTTSFTGLTNPYYMLIKKEDFEAEVCYVTRSYLTRHGDGPLENEIDSKKLNSNIVDPTNCFNNFQGPLRYGIIDKDLFKERIDKDFSLVENDPRFSRTVAITHTNEYNCGFAGDYFSDNRYSLYETK